MESRVAWHSAAMHVSTLLLSGAEPRTVLSVLIEHAMRLGGAAAAAIAAALSDPATFRDPALLRVVAGVGLLDPRSVGELVSLQGIGPTVAAPLGDEMVLLVARTKDEPPFLAPDVEMIVSFAGHAGQALMLAEARKRRERRRLIEDRELIATQLNEQAMQALLRISTAVRGLTARIQSPDDAQRLADQADCLDTVLRQMRRAIFGLRLHLAD